MNAPQFVSSITLLLLFQYPNFVRSQCQLCGDETIDKDKPISLPDPFSFLATCGQLASMASSALAQGSDECQAIQAVGTYCGCSIPENACNLCTDPEGAGHVVTQPNALVEFDLPYQIEPTCAHVEAYLHSVNPQSDQCKKGQSFQDECGCSNSSSITIYVNDTSTREQIPIPSGDDSDVTPPSTCSLCQQANDDSLAFPDKDVSFYVDYIGFPMPTDISVVITCQMVDLYLRGIELESQTCLDARNLLSGICGCPPPEEEKRCKFCPGEELNPDTMVYTTEAYGFPPATCGDIILFTEQRTRDEEICFYARQVRHLCGCNKGEYNYLNSSMIKYGKEKLAWAPRVTGFFSLLGSLYIIWDVIKHHGSNLTVYHELLCGISVFGAIGSVAWMFSSLPIPEFNEYGDPTRIYGAKGTQGTCAAQGFFIQLGYTSVFYNVALSFYYLLTIRYGWREVQTRRYAKWFHTPVLFGLALALAGIPFYENFFLACYLVPPPLAEDIVVVICLCIAPIATGIAVATANMLLVYAKVRTQDAAANRWRMNVQASQDTTVSGCSWRGLSSSLFVRRSTAGERPVSSNKLERSVFWQSLFYLGAFYATWPILMNTYLEGDKKEHSCRYWLTMVTLAPLQGFFNVIVYTRPQMAKKLSQLQDMAIRSRTSGNSTLPYLTRWFGRNSKDNNNKQTKERQRLASR